MDHFRRLHLRQQLRRILFNDVELSRRVVVKVINRLADVFASINYRLILTLPRLDVNDRDSGI